jgi:hypothetical protein
LWNKRGLEDWQLAGMALALGILPIGKFLRVGKLTHIAGHRGK